jgi:hypothetical protein
MYEDLRAPVEKGDRGPVDRRSECGSMCVSRTGVRNADRSHGSVYDERVVRLKPTALELLLPYVGWLQSVLRDPARPAMHGCLIV